MVLIVALVASSAGLLVYLSLNLFLVRPMQRITYAMERFRADPDDPEAGVRTSGRRDEIGRAEVELNLMQADLRTALNSRARLAALGEAVVAKINHDLKNMLTSAQIASERLAALKDPKVSQALPRLERALDRAVKLASGVLAYGTTQEAAPEPRLDAAGRRGRERRRRGAARLAERATHGAEVRRGACRAGRRTPTRTSCTASSPTCCATPARRSSTRRGARSLAASPSAWCAAATPA